MGKAYQKLIAAITAGKPKCGIDASKVFDTAPGGQLDDEMSQLGFFPPSLDSAWNGGEGMAGIDARLMVMQGLANGHSTQNSVN